MICFLVVCGEESYLCLMGGYLRDCLLWLVIALHTDGWPCRILLAAAAGLGWLVSWWACA